MNTNKKTVVNCETGETFEVNLTPEEIEINRLEDEKIQQRIAEAAAKAAAKASAEAKLAALGLSADEIAALSK